MNINDAPYDLANPVMEFFPQTEWDNAVSIAFLESRWDAFSVDNSTDPDHPCGTPLRMVDGVEVVAERSVGYFQINSCNYPDWEWQRLYNGRHNVGTAHLIWATQGWRAWYFSAKQLGLI